MASFTRGRIRSQKLGAWKMSRGKYKTQQGGWEHAKGKGYTGNTWMNRERGMSRWDQWTGGIRTKMKNWEKLQEFKARWWIGKKTGYVFKIDRI